MDLSTHAWPLVFALYSGSRNRSCPKAWEISAAEEHEIIWARHVGTFGGCFMILILMLTLLSRLTPIQLALGEVPPRMVIWLQRSSLWLHNRRKKTNDIFSISSLKLVNARRQLSSGNSRHYKLRSVATQCLWTRCLLLYGHMSYVREFLTIQCLRVWQDVRHTLRSSLMAGIVTTVMQSPSCEQGYTSCIPGTYSQEIASCCVTMAWRYLDESALHGLR